ncbi:hypothetical protein DPMN_107416 [Dreissena polymorpha]|uniref:Uncharacterized protein n=1 Tax=Dreissena polymorpha TaxID=45954 RepID=A0A9D4K6P1_DREPO|nr:hypothetical protein DPMN_107416 [Dreissena polymorpha]
MGALIRHLNYCEGADIRLLNSDMGHLSAPSNLLGGHLSAPLKLGGTSLGSTSRRGRLSGYKKSAQYLKALLKKPPENGYSRENSKQMSEL